MPKIKMSISSPSESEACPLAELARQAGSPDPKYNAEIFKKEGVFLFKARFCGKNDDR